MTGFYAMVKMSQLRLPHAIAETHSLRFEKQQHVENYVQH